MYIWNKEYAMHHIGSGVAVYGQWGIPEYHGNFAQIMYQVSAAKQPLLVGFIQVVNKGVWYRRRDIIFHYSSKFFINKS